MPLNHMRFLANPTNPAVQQSVLRARMAIEILGFGVLSAGNWGVFAAAHTDLFAARPSLSSRLQVLSLSTLPAHSHTISRLA
eukprot:COSAG03_NODE_2548_length_2656_cov_2.577630_1_plen_81_part_10